MTASVVLASQSASRRAMLDAAGLIYDVVPAHVDEAALTAALVAEQRSARAIADALAELKAIKVSARRSDALVIGSDSVVSVNGRLFDKPSSIDEAKHHLHLFSGQEMVLSSAVVVADNGAPVWRHVEAARLQVRALSDAFIDAYLDMEWPAIAGCVGCFRLEGPGVQLFASIRGDYFTILGMPLLPLLGYLRVRGALPS